MNPQQSYYGQATGGQASPPAGSYQTYQGAPPPSPYQQQHQQQQQQQQPAYYGAQTQQPQAQGHYQSQPYGHPQGQAYPAQGQYYPPQGQYPPSPSYSQHQGAPYGHQQPPASPSYQQQQQQPPLSPYGQHQQPPPSPYGQQPPQSPYAQQPPAPGAYGQQPPQQAPYGQQPPQDPYGQKPLAPAPYGQQPSPQPRYELPVEYHPPAQQPSPQIRYELPVEYPPQVQQQLQQQQQQQQHQPLQHAPTQQLQHAPTQQLQHTPTQQLQHAPTQQLQHSATQQLQPVATQQWQQPATGVPPTLASPGYDPAQKALVQHVDTAADVEALRKAMKGMGCDERTLIRVLTQTKYNNPWAMAQLVHDYNSRFMRDLAKDIESETRGDLETVLLALVYGPLENDARILKKALVRAGTDEDALNDVLLSRSNADMRAIVAEYKRIRGHELAVDIKDDVDDTLFRMYSMILSATRAEDGASVIAPEIDQKVTELQRATEGTLGANAVAVAQILVSSNAAQLHAVIEAYQRKYHRSLQDVIEKEFRGDMEDALLRMLFQGDNRAYADAGRLGEPLRRTVRKDRLFINRVVSLYWDRNRLIEAKAAYRKRYGVPLSKDVKDYLSGDYEDAILALIADK